MKLPYDFNQQIGILSNDDYSSLLGKVVYDFARYEWTIISIIKYLSLGYADLYHIPRRDPMTSRMIWHKLIFAMKIYFKSATYDAITLQKLDQCSLTFHDLIRKRNTLIHAHPAIDTEGNPILIYKADPKNPLSDIVWTQTKLAEFILEINNAATDATNILENVSLK